MKKIYEFSAEPFQLRRNFWKQNLSEFAQIQFIDFNLSREELKDQFPKISQDMDAAFVSEAYSKIFFDLFQDISRRILEGKKIDALFRNQGGVWPHCLMRDSLHQLIVQKANKLDTQARAYVTGSDSTMRVALSTVVQLGFSEVIIVVDEVEMAESTLADAGRTFLLVKIHVLKNTELTLQPNNGSLLINTVKLDGREELIEDLSYLNFISLDGLVIDTNLFPLTHQLMAEAENVGLRTLSGAELRAHMDWSFLNKVFGKVSLDMKEYTQKWLEFLKNKS